MKAMILTAPGSSLVERELDIPQPQAGQVQVKVRACGVCRTDLHVVDGELREPKIPLIPGHEIVGTVEKLGDSVTTLKKGDLIGIPWLGWTCGECRYCQLKLENLCDHARFTGYTLDGGYAEYTVADERYCIPIPAEYDPVKAAPLMCAGLIGYRSLMKAGDCRRLGLYGFGAAAHIVAQIARFQEREVYAFTRPGDRKSQEFAASLGAVWAGDSTRPAPVELDAAILFAPVGSLLPAALRAVRKGGIVVCGGIYMTPIPSFPYEILWGERRIISVANLTRKDGEEFMQIVPQVPIETTVQAFPLGEANEALHRLRSGQIEGAAVLVNS